MITREEWVDIVSLHRQGLSIRAISARLQIRGNHEVGVGPGSTSLGGRRWFWTRSRAPWRIVGAICSPPPLA